MLDKVVVLTETVTSLVFVIPAKVKDAVATVVSEAIVVGVQVTQFVTSHGRMSFE